MYRRAQCLRILNLRCKERGLLHFMLWIVYCLFYILCLKLYHSPMLFIFILPYILTIPLLGCHSYKKRFYWLKSLVGSNESWGGGGKCRESYRSAELEAESSRFHEMWQRSYEHLMMCVWTERWIDWYWRSLGNEQECESTGGIQVSN